jgi:acyl-CoA synthetase (AMP-forming)/AMP-acid ligase II
VERRAETDRHLTSSEIPPSLRRTTFNLADLFEAIAAEVPDRPAIVAGDGRRWSYRTLDERSNRFADLLLAWGLGPASRVAILSRNRVEWVEAMLGSFKARAVPVNVEVLASAGQVRRMLDHADAAVLVYERSFAPLVAQVAGQVRSLRHGLVLPPDGDAGGNVACGVHAGGEEHLDHPDLAHHLPYGAALAGASRRGGGAGHPARSGDDLYVLYTGVRRDQPRGVVWRHEDLFFAALCGGGVGGRPITRPRQIVEWIASEPERLRSVVTSRLTHPNGQWTTLVALLGGGAAVFPSPAGFDPHEVWRLVDRERCNTISVLGDRMARPLADALSEGGDRYDTSSLLTISSGGGLLSPEVRVRLQALLPRTLVLDSLGACVHGLSGFGTGGARRRFALSPGVAVLGADLRPLRPGSGTAGRVARRGHIPLGFHKDEATTAAIFVTDPDGVRWAFCHDWARVADDGTVTVVET